MGRINVRMYIDSKLSILFNRTLVGFFIISLGFREGDIVFSFLFIIMLNALGKLISQDRSLGVIKWIPIPSNIEPTTCQYFVDITMCLVVKWKHFNKI